MKSYLWILLCFGLVSTSSFGHIPEYTEFWYNKKKNTISIWVRHHTEQPSKHRISKYEVFIKNKKFELIKSHQDRTEFKVEIPLGRFKPIKKTKVKIRLSCSIYGTKEYYMNIKP